MNGALELPRMLYRQKEQVIAYFEPGCPVSKVILIHLILHNRPKYEKSCGEVGKRINLIK